VERDSVRDSIGIRIDLAKCVSCCKLRMDMVVGLIAIGWLQEPVAEAGRRINAVRDELWWSCRRAYESLSRPRGALAGAMFKWAMLD
jgi:hypothetical protein